MNPQQQMILARLDHQERLQNAQRNQLAGQLKRKPMFSFSILGQRKTGKTHGAVATIKRDTVTAN